jgi:hypothetical protein
MNGEALQNEEIVITFLILGLILEQFGAFF